ncbi:MAG: M17 family metallopeptidase [Leucobacter sp.]|jgi:leucyl aminopeptidase
MTVVIDPAFNPVPSLDRQVAVSVTSESGAAPGGALAVFVAAEGDLPEALTAGGLDRDALAAAGFTGKQAQTLVMPGASLVVLVGTGEGIATAAQLRDAVAAFTRAAKESADLNVNLSEAAGDLDALAAAQAATEGAILARYRYDALIGDPKTVQLERLVLVVSGDEDVAEQAELGVERGLILARTASLARDLANTPPRHLSAVKFAEVIERLAPQFGLEADVYDRAALIELGCGGLLGVNAGSVEEPRMVRLRYTPEGESNGHLALIGKGIMYDSGGISLKPSNAMHAAMKLDMMGAAAVFSSMTALRELGSTTAVSGWLMCTDNMPSGSATKLGDVLTIRGGTTVEVKNTDAEGRLVMADGLVLATEDRAVADRRPDAIVDIATLTGAAMAALGTRTAAMLANDDAIAEQLQAAADATDENIWRLPLDHRYRDQLKSNVADLSNIGGQYAGAILAGLFLGEFVDGAPWGHLDIAGTMQAESDDLWRSVGSTGFGARLLAEFAVGFEAPAIADAAADESAEA